MSDSQSYLIFQLSISYLNTKNFVSIIAYYKKIEQNGLYLGYSHWLVRYVCALSSYHISLSVLSVGAYFRPLMQWQILWNPSKDRLVPVQLRLGECEDCESIWCDSCGLDS